MEVNLLPILRIQRQRNIIRPGDGQRMSAGTGIRHSEANVSKPDPVHLLQIWILPSKQGIRPGYEQKAFPEGEKRGRLCLIASPDGSEGALTIHQDAKLFVAQLKNGKEVEHDLPPGRHAWLQVAGGSVELHGQRLEQGDGAAISDERQLVIRGNSADSEILLFDLA